jgi:hypothetical protein
LEDRSIDVEIKLKWLLKKMNERLWTALTWLNTGTRDSFLRTVINLRLLWSTGNFLTSIRSFYLSKKNYDHILGYWKHVYQVANTKEGSFYFISLPNEYCFSSWKK